VADTLLIPDLGGYKHTARAIAVYTRAYWKNEWTPQPYMYANTLRWGSGPVRSEAVVEWRYGIGMPAGTNALATFTPQSLVGQYLRVDVAQEVGEPVLRWYGIITEDADDRHGAFIVDGARIKSGVQTLIAEGLDLLLQRGFCDRSTIRKIGGGETGINRGLTFNDPNTFDDTGNRSWSALPPTNTYVFASDLYDANWWSSKTILEYILAHLAPRITGNYAIKWELSSTAKNILPTWDRPVVRAHGRDLRSIINEICDRRRNLSWRLVPEDTDADSKILLDAFPFNAYPITLPGGETVYANQNQQSIDFDRAIDARVMLRKTDHDRVDQVVVRGARRRAIVTLSNADGTLEGDWKTDDMTAYQTLPSAISSLTDLDRKESRMARYRSEDRLQRVWSWFRLPEGWDGKVGDGKGAASGAAKIIFCKDDDEGDETFYMAELRFERGLPKELAPDANPDASPHSLVPPICAIQVEDDGTGVDRWVHVEDLAADTGSERMGDGGRSWDCSLKVQDDVPGVIIRVNGVKHGAGQHLIAGSQFYPISAINDKEAELDWKTIILTVMFEIDRFVEARYPEDGDLPWAIESPRRLYVDIGDRGRMDWVTRGAVRKLLDGKPQYRNGDTPDYQNEGEWLRDDRPMMRDLARFLYDYHSTVRKAFTVQLRQLSGICYVGDLISTIGADETLETVNAVVTCVSMDLIEGTTTIDTGFAEIDPIQFAGFAS